MKFNVVWVLPAVSFTLSVILGAWLYLQSLQLASLMRENSELKALTKRLLDELNMLRDEVGVQRLELLSQLSSHNASVTRSISYLNSAVSSLNQKTLSIEKEQNRLEDRVLTLEHAENNLTITLIKLNYTVKDILSENQQLNSKITAIENRITRIENPEYIYIGTWQSKGDFITKETFTGKTKIRILYYFTGSSWDSWFSIWLSAPDGTLISRLVASSGYYTFNMVEVYVAEDTYRLSVFVTNGEVTMALFTQQ